MIKATYHILGSCKESGSLNTNAFLLLWIYVVVVSYWYLFHLVTVLKVDSFERLLGPCMDVMKRNIENYEQQLMRLFGTSLDLSELRQWGLGYSWKPNFTLKRTMTLSYYYYYYMYSIIIILLSSCNSYYLACSLALHVILKQLTVILIYCCTSHVWCLQKRVVCFWVQKPSLHAGCLVVAS